MIVGKTSQASACRLVLPWDGADYSNVYDSTNARLAALKGYMFAARGVSMQDCAVPLDVNDKRLMLFHASKRQGDPSSDIHDGEPSAQWAHLYGLDTYVNDHAHP
jgi:hypothetical protein